MRTWLQWRKKNMTRLEKRITFRCASRWRLFQSPISSAALWSRTPWWIWATIAWGLVEQRPSLLPLQWGRRGGVHMCAGLLRFLLPSSPYSPSYALLYFVLAWHSSLDFFLIIFDLGVSFCVRKTKVWLPEVAIKRLCSLGRDVGFSYAYRTFPNVNFRCLELPILCDSREENLMQKYKWIHPPPLPPTPYPGKIMRFHFLLLYTSIKELYLCLLVSLNGTKTSH